MMWCLHTVSICVKLSSALRSLPITCHEKLFKLPKNIVLMILLWERDQHSHRPDKNQICCQDFCVCTVICLFLGSSEPSQQIEGCSFHEYPEYRINWHQREQKYPNSHHPNCHEKWVHHILPGVIITKYGDDQNGHYLHLICVKFAISKIF